MKRLAAALTVVAAIGALPAWGGTPARAPDDDRPRLDLRVTEQDFGVAPGGTWTARLSVSGDVDELLGALPTTTTSTTSTPSTSTTAAVPGLPATTTTAVDTGTTPTTNATATGTGAPSTAVVEVVAHRRIDTTLELREAQDGELGETLDRVIVPVDDVLTRTAGRGEIAVAVETASEAGDSRLTLRRAGLYPLSITVRLDGTVIGERVTFVERLPLDAEDDPPLGVALVATLDDLAPDAGAAEERTARRQLDALVELGTVVDAPLAVSMPPSVAELAGGDPTRAREVAAALTTANLLALPSLALDPSSAVAIDRVDAFSGEVRKGEDILAATFPDVPVQRAAWLVNSPLSTAGAATLRDPLGYRLFVFDEATYRTLDGNIGDFTDSSLAFEVALGDGDSLPAMLASPLGRFIDDERGAGRTVAEEAVDVIASLVVGRRELGPELRRDVVLMPPDGGVPDADTAAALTGYVAELPGVEMTSLGRIAGATDTIQIDGDPLTVALPDEAGRDLSERAERIAITEVAVEAFGSMFADDEGRDAWLAELDALLSTALDDETVDAQLRTINDELEAVRTSVVAPDPFTFTLTGRTSVLRLTLRNNADEPRVVRLRAASPKLRFPEGEQLVTLQPGPNEVTLDVEARANGTSSVSIELLTPVFGRPITEPTFLTATVNALTGLGQVITGGAVLVLVTWWFSHFRRRRRERANPSPIVVVDDEPVVSPDAAEAAAHVPDHDGALDPDELPPTTR